MNRPSTSPVPQWPTITATVRSDGSGEVHLSPSIAEPITADSVDDARMLVLERVAAYALEKHGRAVRLKVRDPAGEWLLAVDPDGTVSELEADTSIAPEHPGAASADDPPPQITNDAPTPAPPVIRVVEADQSSPPALPLAAVREGAQPVDPAAAAWSRSVDRKALHSRPPGPSRTADQHRQRPSQRSRRTGGGGARPALRSPLSGDRHQPAGRGLTKGRPRQDDRGADRRRRAGQPAWQTSASRRSTSTRAAEPWRRSRPRTERRGSRCFSCIETANRFAPTRSCSRMSPRCTRASICWRCRPTRAWPCRSSLDHYEELFDEVLMPNYNLLGARHQPGYHLASDPAGSAARNPDDHRARAGLRLKRSGYPQPALPAWPTGGRRRRVAGDRGHQPGHQRPARRRAGRAPRRDPRERTPGRSSRSPGISISAPTSTAATTRWTASKRRTTRLPLKRLALHVAENFA